MEAVLFIIFAALAIVAALGVILSKNPINSAISLIGVMGMLFCLYLMLNAHFVAIIQLMVYAGAIMVLFVFVIMLLNQRGEGFGFAPSLFTRSLAVMASVFVGAVILGKFAFEYGKEAAVTAPKGFGTIEKVGSLLYRDYLFPFEAVSILLLAAIVGAVVLAKRKA